MAATRPVEAVDVRCARDRLIDLLGLGETYPVKDVDVEAEQLTVVFGNNCAIDVDPAQAGVRYSLCIDQRPIDPARYTADGTGSAAALPGPPITEDRTFRILAAKKDLPERTDFLLRTATIKVGLDLGIPRSAERVVDYKSAVAVHLDRSQPGATYGLFDATQGKTPPQAPALSERMAGSGTAITLTSAALLEDTKLGVDVEHTFADAEKRPTLTGVLAAGPLPIAVRANPGLTVTVTDAVIDPGGYATLTIAGSQAGVFYQAWARTLGDVEVALSPIGDAVRSGGGDLSLRVGPLGDDTMVVVEARKTHWPTESIRFDSTVRLAQAVVVLVRPNPLAATSLKLQVTPGADLQSGTLRVSGGQVGVFYYFYRTGEPNRIGLPAYFHNPNKGIAGVENPRSGLRIGTDFVVRSEPATPVVVDIAPLPKDGKLDVMAIKARTGIGWSSRTSATTTP